MIQIVVPFYVQDVISVSSEDFYTLVKAVTSYGFEFGLPLIGELTMAILTRPGVEISQEIITESPTVLTPSLVPCVVGPCFQIVEPITSAGLLNSGAQVTTSAIIVSSTVSDPAALSGLAMLVSINGGDNQTVQFPVTINNVGLSHALIVNTINKALTGAVAEIKNNKLILRTESKGASSSIKLLTVANAAYTVLGLASFENKLIRYV